PLVDWISRHELVLFFACTMLFSWGILAVASQFSFENETTFNRIIAIAAYGPSLSAILLTAITTTESRQKDSRLRIVWFLPFLLVLVAGIEWSNNIWWEHPFDQSLILADAILVIVTAFVLYWLFIQRTEASQKLLGAPPSRVKFVWYIAAFGLWPALILAGNAIARVLGLSVPPSPSWPDMPILIIVLQAFVWYLLFGGPLNEEPGWRGFALPRLQNRFSPLIASIILGVIWGLWHVPEHLMGVYDGGALGAAMRVMEIPRAILFTWLYNRTKGSLLIVLLFHTAINTTSSFLPRSVVIVFILCIVLAVAVVLKDKMWRRLPEV
ncbi:MAG: type II CAAX prenyl endopeptidase Rce1 family protein, partial [Omnitrophica WOR_2 bacterium]